MPLKSSTKFHFILMLVAAVFLGGCTGDKTVSYAKDVLPVLSKHCFECHTQDGDGLKASGLDMSSYAGLMKGTKFGPVIKAGDGLSSTLVILVEGRADSSIKMPHGKSNFLSNDETALIRNWIDQGAKNN